MFQKGYKSWNTGTAKTTVHVEHGRRVVLLPNRNRIYYTRFLMEKELGRKLLKTEHIHHKDGNKLNDSLENLEVIDIRDHAKLHSTGKEFPSRRKRKLFICAKCGKRYELKLSRAKKVKVRSFCSIDCRREFKFPFPRKKNNAQK